MALSVEEGLSHGMLDFLLVLLWRSSRTVVVQSGCCQDDVEVSVLASIGESLPSVEAACLNARYLIWLPQLPPLGIHFLSLSLLVGLGMF